MHCDGVLGCSSGALYHLSLRLRWKVVGQKLGHTLAGTMGSTALIILFNSVALVDRFV